MSHQGHRRQLLGRVLGRQTRPKPGLRTHLSLAEVIPVEKHRLQPGEPCTPLGCSLSSSSLLVMPAPDSPVQCASLFSSQHPQNSQTRQTHGQTFTRGMKASGRPSSLFPNTAGPASALPPSHAAKQGFLFPELLLALLAPAVSTGPLS